MAGDLVDRFRLLVAACCDQNLSPAARAVLAKILDHYNTRTGQCTPSLDRLARTSGLARRSVVRAVKELREKGWIDRDHSTREDTRAFGSNHFRPAFERGDLGTERSLPRDEVVPTPGDETVPRVGTKRCAEVGTKRSPEPSKKNQGKGTKSESIDDAAFDRFWQAYPRRVAKAAARQVFDRILTKAQATADQLVEGAERYAAATAGKDPEHIAHAKTWLNGERWTDEPVRHRDSDIGSTAQPHHPNSKPNSATAYLMERRARRMSHG
ncbi:helix-turn-helix domain-containing protein [Methylobacterium sp. J-077]|uniref:helix-turn-helix domain-containing protein n=1 Tax=Methylobacterium sp. J-077 TaxID=2836656 RepID=UPI001FBA1EB2|nr:helix-turn-helix domain-containing protein [Methylobacterium sp. J-077]MCJ2125115.1 helix-turn-helix domain-containing protein [Methylobacterium sp. J-077]